MKKNLGLLISCLILVIVVVFVFSPITRTFYQQDEWLGYGLYLAKGTGIILQSTGGFWGIVLAQGRILTNFLYFLFYRYFPLNVFPIAVFAILLHSINVLIVFYLARKLFKKTLPAFMGSLFFAVNSVSQNAIVWPAASFNTLPSTTLIILSIYFFFRHIENLKKRCLIVSFLMIYLSLYFKETGIFLLLFLPISALFFNKYSFKNYIKSFWYYFLSVGIIVSYRLLGFMLTPHSEALFLTGSSKYFIDSLIIRSIFYPITSFSLTLIPSEPMVWFARYIENVQYPFFMTQEFILIAQTVIIDLIAVILTFLMLSLITVLMKSSDKNERKKVIFFVTFSFLSFIPYVIISKNYSYLESRYFYVSTFSAAITLGWFLDKLLTKTKYLLPKLILVFTYVLFIGIHIKYLKSDISAQTLFGNERKYFLSQLSQQVPILSKNKNVFLITSDRDYYIEGNKVPFQQGFGYTLEAYYFSSGKIDKSLLNDGYLFELGSEGYREINGLGFGYFGNTEKLKQSITNGEFSKLDVISFYYDTSKGVLYKKSFK